MAVKKATTKQIAAPQTVYLDDAAAAVDKMRSAMNALDSVLTGHKSALAAQKAIHYGDHGIGVGDALGWTMNRAYETAEALDKCNADLWMALRDMTATLGIDNQPARFFGRKQ